MLRRERVSAFRPSQRLGVLALDAPVVCLLVVQLDRLGLVQLEDLEHLLHAVHVDVRVQLDGALQTEVERHLGLGQLLVLVAVLEGGRNLWSLGQETSTFQK